VTGADYYRNDFTGNIHRRGCKHASARHGKPRRELNGKTVSDLIDDAEGDSRLEFLHLSLCCFDPDEIDQVNQRRYETKIPQMRRST
jgi:hypothetical protein